MTFHLDEGEGGSRGEGFVLVFDLVPQILLHAFLLKHPLLQLGAEQDARRDRHGHGVLWLWLRGRKKKTENTMDNGYEEKRPIETQWKER